LWVIPAEGGAPVRIGESSQTRVPRWSPDGRTVFYRLEAPDSGRAAGVWAVPVEGGVPRNVLRFESRSGFMPPYFAIDRGRLFFPRGEYEGDIWSMNLDISSR
jgi:Tol biopolymer transport system component